MKQFFIILFSTLVLLACGPTGKKPVTYAYSTDFIEMCIDSVLGFDKHSNTTTYLVDFSDVKDLPDTSIQHFFTRNKRSKPTNLDSLHQHDTTWQKSHSFAFTVIKFENIEERNDTIIANVARINGMYRSNSLKIIFRRKGTAYEYLHRKVTRSW